MTNDNWYENSPDIKKEYDKADDDEKALIREIENFIRNQPKKWKDVYVSLPKDEVGLFLQKSMEEHKHYLEVAKKETDKKLREKLLNATHEERKGFYMAAAEEQKRILFNEPWLLRRFSYEDRMSILAEYTPDQQANMKARMDLEDDFRREKRGGFG